MIDDCCRLVCYTVTGMKLLVMRLVTCSVVGRAVTQINVDIPYSNTRYVMLINFRHS